MNAIDKDTVTLDKLRGKTAGETGPEPRIGDALDGGIYMGVVRGENGEPDYRLVDLGEAPESLAWEAAKKWAAEKGGSLPTCREQSVMFGNRGEGQYAPTWYWSCEQYAGYDACAWAQYFGNGNQSSIRKDTKYRARAVRRVPGEGVQGCNRDCRYSRQHRRHWFRELLRPEVRALGTSLSARTS